MVPFFRFQQKVLPRSQEYRETKARFIVILVPLISVLLSILRLLSSYQLSKSVWSSPVTLYMYGGDSHLVRECQVEIVTRWYPPINLRIDVGSARWLPSKCGKTRSYPTFNGRLGVNASVYT